MSVLCPSCQSKDHMLIGKIPHMNTLAGRPLPLPFPRTSLIKCTSCNLYFRWPRFDKQQLEKSYQEANIKTRQHQLINRKDWQIAIGWINREITQGSILDIGCSDGNFLENLKEDWKLYGVEINAGAANKALSKGIEIIAKNISEMPSLSIKVNVTTAFDMVEHVDHPLDFLASMAHLTRTDGMIILSSGNTEATIWKLMKNNYWYCSIPDHLSFINQDWCYFAAKKLNLQIAHLELFSHAFKNGPFQKVMDLTKNVVYLTSPFLYTNLRKTKYRHCGQKAPKILDYPPSWMTNKDHLIIAFKKHRKCKRDESL